MSGEKTKVLIADDEPHIRLLIKTVISSLGMDVVAEASDGQEAVNLFAEKRPDLALLDINMPRMTGIEALKEIVAKNPEACVLMLTSVSDIDSVSQCLDSGASNYIRKDTPIEEIKALIRETCP